MAVAQDEEKKSLLAAVARLLGGRADGGAAERFAEALYGRGSAEDLTVYTAEELAAVAEASWHRFLAREPGRPRVSVLDVGPGATGHLAEVTVVEVLNDNMPFLVDSVMGELTESGLSIRLVLHPILAVKRDAVGRLDRLDGIAVPRAPHETQESLIHIHVARIVSPENRDALAARLAAALGDVRMAVRDWRTMLGRVDAAIEAYLVAPPPLGEAEVSEAVEFMTWLRDNNFTFLGTREYTYFEENGEGRLDRVEGSSLGVLADQSLRVLRRGSEGVNASREMADFLRTERALIITKSNIWSRIHRRVHMDYVGIKLYAPTGELAGELRIVGLFTSTAYTQSCRTIPYLRRKVDEVVRMAGFDPSSHSGKALLNVLESHPRDELFQLDEATLYDFALQIMALDEHPRVRVLARRDVFDRFVSVLVYVPRERYHTEVRVRIGEYFERVFLGRVAAWQPAFPEGSLARVHFIVGRYEGATPEVPQDELEKAVAAIVRTWNDELTDAIERAHDPLRAHDLVERYGKAFGADYREAYPPPVALADLAILERLGDDFRIAIDFERGPGDPDTRLNLKLFATAAVPLSDRVPVLENMGLRVIDERTYLIRPDGRPELHLHDMTLERADGGAIVHDETIDKRIEALFVAVWFGRAENDGFNALGLLAGLGWREIAHFRAYARYLRQIRIPYGLDYMAATLAREPDLAKLLAELFRVRFDPDMKGDREVAENKVVRAIESGLDAVESLDDDTILRRFLNAVRSTLRTNSYQLEPSGLPRETLAFKLDSRAVTDLPEPKPFREIWVYSPRVEGIHMRFGKVARGGLRWSDRPQDFRTEVLGLVKAQQVKNAVIVPVGAKGGFLPKWLKPGMARDAFMAEGTAAYKIFVSTLLTVTDNLGPAGVIPPERVVRHEPDDPYLVVAADKGTATFSDTANAISEQHGYWLGDAFASGGSAGYDHKKMGITARGAFEAVKRHFREMDVDIMTTPFSVAGVGDMSGDVFGNGMLLAPTIRLVAAFDHRDIFIDPDPDMAASFAERARLFALPRSSWQDYDKARLSQGGGIHPRSAKSIDLSPEAQALLALPHPRATPQEIMRAILTLPVDLLWFGGIGTYIRAEEEADAEVGDKANDAIRVTARAVRAKVIGEGANLGVTQRARIAFNRLGGRCNSDAIDNSAGVNSSDVEVNIKIGLGRAEQDGRLTRPDRNVLLASMTDEVAGLVLRNNYLQPLAISLCERRGMEDFGYQRRFMQELEREGRLNRAVEVLPDDAGLAEREKAGEPLTRAEIGVLLAYAKLTLKEDLLESSVPDDAYLSREMRRYFPSRMVERYPDDIEAHRLRREIIATGLANAMINRGGPTLLTRIGDQTGADAAAIAQAFAATRDTFGLTDLNGAIDALDSKVAGALQLRLYAAVQDMALNGIVWMLRNADFREGLGRTIERFQAGRTALERRLARALPAGLAAVRGARAAELTEAGVPAPLADRLAGLDQEAAIPDIVLVAERARLDLERAAATYFAVADRFGIDGLARLSRGLPILDYYDGLALDRARGTLADAHRRITVGAAQNDKGLDGWLTSHKGEVDRTLAAVGDILNGGTPTVSRFMVASGLVADLAAH
jgi:glutamate dehydrogenase